MRAIACSFVLCLSACVVPLPPFQEPVTDAPQTIPEAIPVAERPVVAEPQVETGWQRVGSSRVRPLEGGVAWLHEFRASHDGGSSAEVQMVLFDGRHSRVRVVDQPDSWAGGGALDDTLRAIGAVAGVNGGFFAPDFAPLGLMIADGRKTGAWQANRLLSGALAVATACRSSCGTPRGVAMRRRLTFSKPDRVWSMVDAR